MPSQISIKIFVLLSLIWCGFAKFARVEIFFIRHAKSIWNDVRDPLSETNSRRSPSPLYCGTRSRSSSSSSDTQQPRVRNGSLTPPPPPPPIPTESRSISPSIFSENFYRNFQYVTGTINSLSNTVYGYMKGNFYDANLSPEGIEQANRLACWIDRKCPASYDLEVLDPISPIPDECVLNRPIVGTALFVSNLKRTRETMLTGLRYRFHEAFFVANRESRSPDNFFETIHVMNELQERECNQDARLHPENVPELEGECIGSECAWKFSIVADKILPPDQKPTLRDICDDVWFMDKSADPERPGSSLGETRTFKRVIYEFFRKLKFENIQRIILVGHSNWLRRFFVNRLIDLDEIGDRLKRDRIDNTAIVKFNLVANVDEHGVINIANAKIEPGTVRIVYNPSNESARNSPSFFDMSPEEHDVDIEEIESKKGLLQKRALRELLRNDSAASVHTEDEDNVIN